MVIIVVAVVNDENDIVVLGLVAKFFKAARTRLKLRTVFLVALKKIK